MLDAVEQGRVLQRVASAAAERDLFVAPVGSLYFLFRGEAAVLTKDVDAVILGHDLRPVALDVLERLGRVLGDVEVAHDRASVKVTVPQAGEAPVVIDLLRGRAGGKGGFLNRDLLCAAAEKGERTANVILFPPEYVLMLKAEAAVDRAVRAQKADAHAQENAERAERFRHDVFTQVRAIEKKRGLDVRHLQDALALVKRNRRAPIAELFDAATGGRIRLAP